MRDKDDSGARAGGDGSSCVKKVGVNTGRGEYEDVGIDLVNILAAYTSS